MSKLLSRIIFEYHNEMITVLLYNKCVVFLLKIYSVTITTQYNAKINAIKHVFRQYMILVEPLTATN